MSSDVGAVVKRCRRRATPVTTADVAAPFIRGCIASVVPVIRAPMEKTENHYTIPTTTDHPGPSALQQLLDRTDAFQAELRAKPFWSQPTWWEDDAGGPLYCGRLFPIPCAG